ncbi:MAG TPA: hypothetical protein VKZ98_00050 [Aquaticitalea sp.]|nr:hypothetical protein [Aquaticitalea sp.]
MFLRICKITIFLVAINSISVSAQSNDVEKQRAEYEKKALEEMDSRIREFTGQLQVDDFQKEIIKQKIHSYFEERKKIFYNQDLKYFERDEQLLTLTNTHFSDIKNIINEDTMEQIKSFLKDGGAEMKKNKRRNKKKTKKD